MPNRYRELLDACVRISTEGPGKLPVEVRRDILEKLDAPGLLRGYVRKVSCCAPTVTDEDVDRLKQAGLGDDEIFEATVQAATQCALQRLHAGLKAMRIE